jgi:kumamolisin
MRKRTRAEVIALTFFGVLVLFLFFWLLGPRSSSSSELAGRRFVLTGNTPLTVKSAQLVGHSDPGQLVKIVVGLKLRDEAQLDALLARQADPASADFRKYLTPDEFTKLYAPTQADYDQVVAYLQSQGLKVTIVVPNRLIIGAEGTVEQLEKAFGVTINQYRWRGMKHLSNASDPQIPTSLQGIVQSVIGLNSFAQFRAKNMPGPRVPGVAKQLGPFGLTPAKVATAYNFPNASNTRAVNNYSGKGVTIAIATAYSYNRSDVDTFWSVCGITRTGQLTNIHVGGVATQANGETTLDLEQAGAHAPGADILMYMGADPEFSTFALVFNQIVTDNKADVVSVSWGLCERDTGVAQMNTEHVIFKQAAAQGIPIFAASGDDGAYDCKEPEPDGEHHHGDPVQTPGKGQPPAKVMPAVDYPGSDPCVVAVGGTNLFLKSNFTRSNEGAWTGSGGGASDQWPRPVWQTGKGLPKNDRRNSADVSLAADPWTGYAVYFEGVWDTGGGTSFGAPAWAGLWALVDEAAGGRVGHVHEIVYEIGRSSKYNKVFFDVTQGDNGDGRGAGFSAGLHWDHPTGWGSPDGEALAEWVKNQQTKPAAGLPAE